MSNPLSTIRKVAASLAIAATVVILPSLVGAVSGSKLSLASVPVALAYCGYGYSQEASAGLPYGIGTVYLYMNNCNRSQHTYVVSSAGNQSLYAAVVYAGVCENQYGQAVPCSGHYTGTSASGYGTSLNTGEFLTGTASFYQGYACEAGYCAATGWVYVTP